MENIIVLKCSLVDLKVDIIVNAANKTLLGGGGIDGVIHRKAGKGLLEECKRLNGCETGEAKMSDSYNLICDKVIHTVGPIYNGGKYNESELLSNCYKNSLTLADEYMKSNNLDSVNIAFPCISTGVYHYPKNEACKIAISTVKKYIKSGMNVIFVCFDDDNYNIYIKELYGLEIM